MNKALRGAGLLLALLFLATGITLAATYTEDVELSIPASPGLHLSVSSGNGQISVRTWNGSDILVTATKSVTAWSSGRARSVAETIKIEVEQKGETVRIAPVFRHYLFVGQKVTFNILVPIDWIGQVDLRTSNGAIVVEGLNGDLNLNSSNGRIEVDGHAGRLSVHTSNGRIDLRHIDTTLYARSSNGRITIHDALLRGTGEIRTSNGRITVEGAIYPNGDYEVRTSNGDVAFDLQEPVNLRVDIYTSNGSVRLDGLEVRTTEFGRGTLKGAIGLAEASLLVRTSNGDITLAAR